MMQTALDFIADNQTGRTDIWICSDARENDWDGESTRWDGLKSEFSKLDGIQFHLFMPHISATRSTKVTMFLGGLLGIPMVSLRSDNARC